MTAPWKILLEAGVPLGPPRPAPVACPSAPLVRAALEAVMGGELDEIQAAATLAWLAALAHHWPTSFRTLTGDVGPRAMANLEARAVDPGRYLKLRRIAIANLAGIV